MQLYFVDRHQRNASDADESGGGEKKLSLRTSLLLISRDICVMLLISRDMCNDSYWYSTCLHANLHAYMHHACACVSGPVSGPVPVCIMRTNMHLHA